MQYEVDSYTLEYREDENKYYISFVDSANQNCRMEINENIYNAYMESKKEYTKIKNQNTRYSEQKEQTEINLYSRAISKHTDVEGEFLRQIELMNLEKAKNELTPKQRRRLELHIEDKLTIKQIATIEGVCRSKIDKSISQSLKKLRNFFK